MIGIPQPSVNVVSLIKFNTTASSLHLNSTLPTMPRPIPLLLLLLVSATLTLTQAAKFSVNGPVLTVTLKEPEPKTPSLNLGSSVADAFSSSKASSSNAKPWLDLTTLRPSLYWTLQSNGPPLPNWLPGWKTLRTNVGYRYDELKRLPSFVETDLKFRSERLNAELQIQPSYELKPKRTNLLLQLSRGTSYVLARFSASHDTRQVVSDDIDWETTAVNERSSQVNGLDFVKASYSLDFPATSSLSNIRISPSFDVAKGEPSCHLEGTTGGSGRSKAILKLNYQNPTLAVVHAVDDRNTISPEISLDSAKILYVWQCRLPRGASIRTRVDPTSAIDVTWSDTSAADGGRWVTDFRLPLEGTTVQALASDVRVRRQFNF